MLNTTLKYKMLHEDCCLSCNKNSFHLHQSLGVILVDSLLW